MMSASACSSPVSGMLAALAVLASDWRRESADCALIGASGKDVDLSLRPAVLNRPDVADVSDVCEINKPQSTDSY